MSYWLKIKKSNFSSIESKSIFEQVIKYIFKNENKYYGVLLFISLLIIFIIRTISLFSLKFFINQKKLSYFYLFSIINYNEFILVGPLGSARYRLFIDPILILFFSIGLEQLLKYYKKHLN